MIRQMQAWGLALTLGALVGCVSDDPATKKSESASTDEAAAPQGGAVKTVQVGPNVYLEIQGEQRRVRINAYVCLRQGQLEQLLTRKRSKEHESVLAAEIDARHLQAALLLTGAEKGSPVKFRPKFQPPTGTAIKVTLEYVDPKTKEKVRIPAGDWVRNFKTRKALDSNWVFAGSVEIADPQDATKPPFFGANEGDVICLSNFDTALLDVPISSSGDNEDLAFEAFTERIPPQETPVAVILEPVATKKK